MTLAELRRAFGGETTFRLKTIYSEDEFEINNLLWGTPGFGDMTFARATAVGTNTIIVSIGLPDEVFKAYKKYSRKNVD